MLDILVIRVNANKLKKNSGGSERFVTLLEGLSSHNIKVLSLSWSTEGFKEVLENNIEYVSPSLPMKAVKKYNYLMSRYPGISEDIMFLLMKKELLPIQNMITELSNSSDIVIIDGHQASVLLGNVKVPIIYNAHNAEMLCAKQIYDINKDVEKRIKKVERCAITKSTAFTYCSEEDFKNLKLMYGEVPQSIYIPNGSDKKQKTSYLERMESNNIIFVGTAYSPNMVAAHNIIEIARYIPEKNFVIIGECGEYLDEENIPDNVIITRTVTDEELDKYFSEAFAFINPVESGSGTHLKNMRALSYGLPTISSVIGSRGFSEDEKNKAMTIASSIYEIKLAINFLSIEENFKEKSDNGYEVFANYDWENIKEKYKNFVEDIAKR